MKTAVLGLRTETSLHAGAGKAVGVIDLPIMREAHTDWPVVFGSAVKGAMRAKAEQVQLATLIDVFGPDTKNASDHAGALAVGDARLLLLPVRSLTTHFKWVTCPALLRRAAADAKRMGLSTPTLSLPPIQDEEALSPNAAGGLFLEEFHFKTKTHDLSALIRWLSGFVGKDFESLLAQQLVIVSDDVFGHLAKYATPITPHIAIEKEHKTVKDGALWYEETLPPDTILYVCLAAEGSRRKGATQSADEVLKATLNLFPAERPYLQLGGNETVGMGWCRVHPVNTLEA
jgi:CRISPR-associated protein Cmr4